MTQLADVVVLNWHSRYTGVSASIRHVVPIQQKHCAISVVDQGNLGLRNTIPLWHLFCYGWRKPKRGSYRILHARRTCDMQLGLLLKYGLRQPWYLVFSSAAPKRHGWFMHRLIGSMDAVIATSKRAASFLPKYTAIIHHGVDVARFKPKPEKKVGYTIGVFGRIRPSKGSDLVVAAMIELLPQYPNWSVFFTGLAKDAAYLARLQASIDAAGLSDRIVFLGDLTQQTIIASYQRCDLVVAASRREGFGLTPLEAMATGVPVVASHAGFWPELIQEGINGALFKTGDVDDLKRVLAPMMASPDRLASLGQRARQMVCKHHSIEQEARAINALYEQVFSASGSS